MIIQSFTSMSGRHSSNAGMNEIEDCPQCLQHLTIDLPCPFNEAGSKSGVARVDMAMYMKQSNGSYNLHIRRKM
jgi:hypothetical protein